MDGIETMVAKLITLPRTLLVAGVLAMAPAAFAFAQTPIAPTTASVSTSASPAAATVKQDATVKAPGTNLGTQAAQTTPKTDVKPVAKTETGTKKVKAAKKTPVKAETKSDAKVDTKTPAAPATPAVQPKS